MKVLIITAFLPYPLNNGGRVRQYHMLKRLAQNYNHEIVLVSFIQSMDELVYLPILQSFCTRIETVLRKKSMFSAQSISRFNFRKKQFLNLLNCIFVNEPLGVLQFLSGKMQAKIKAVMSEQVFDIVQIEFTQMASYVPQDSKIPTVLIEHDVDFIRQLRNFRNTSRPIPKFESFFEWLKTKKYEIEMCQKYKKVIVMSSVDKEVLLAEDKNLDISVVGNGVDTAYFKPMDMEYDNRTLVFLGSPSHGPNLDGLRYFCKEIYPKVRARLPNIRLAVLGEGWIAAFAEFCCDKGITLKGYVEDLRPYLAHCAALIVPLRVGSGTRLKILEALAMGCPVVSTSVGCEGLEVTNEKDILIADKPAEFACRIVDVTTDTRLRQRISKNARRLAETEYSWDKIVVLQDQVYREMVEMGDYNK